MLEFSPCSSLNVYLPECFSSLSQDPLFSADFPIPIVLSFLHLRFAFCGLFCTFISYISFRAYLLPLPRRICNHHCLFVCLPVCPLATLCKNFKTDLHEIFRKVGNGPVNKWLNHGGDLDDRSRSGYGSVSVLQHW